MPTYTIIWLISGIISLICTKLTQIFFVKKGWVEDPTIKQKKTKNATALYPVPRGGGIPIFIAILICILLFLPINTRIIAIILAMLITLVVGILDDIFDLSPRLRLTTNLIAALIIVVSGIGIAYISNPFAPGTVIDLSHPQLVLNFFGDIKNIWIISDILAVIWIVALMNITGWSAGVEGQLPGYVSISAFFVGLVALSYQHDPSQLAVIVLSAALSGAYAGFLPFNFYPQKIMPGYSGKSLAGLLMAVLAILAGAKVATLILMLWLPILDATIVILRRIKNKKPIMLSDGQHLHHLLLKLGYSRKQISIFYWLCSLAAGIIAINLNSTQKFFTFIGFTLFFIALLLVVYRQTLSSPTRSTRL